MFSTAHLYRANRKPASYILARIPLQAPELGFATTGRLQVAHIEAAGWWIGRSGYRIIHDAGKEIWRTAVNATQKSR